MEKKRKFKIIIKKKRAELMQDKIALTCSILLLITGIIFTFLASNYTTKKTDVVIAQDLILDNLPVLEWVALNTYWPILMTWVAIIYAFGFATKKVPYYVFLTGLLYLIRAGFITLTHLQTPPEGIPPLNYDINNDLFFSGHVAFPFLAFFMFDNKYIKAFMLLSSFLMAATVLVTHRHYSIDVASAFFITYALYKIGDKIFAKLKNLKR